MDRSVFAPAAEVETRPSRWSLREDVFAGSGEVSHGEPEDVTWRAGESGPAGHETGGLEAEGFPPGRYELELEGYGSPAGSYELPAGLAGGCGPRRPGYLCVQRVPLLANHRGRKPDLILRWNVSSVPEVIDVVVHLHGFWYAGMTLRENIEPVSGLDLTPVKGSTGHGRSRPTLTVLPKGNDTGRKQKVRQKDGSLTDGPLNVFNFPQLTTPDGVTRLINFSLGSFAAQLGGVAPRVGRRILTAHSGGGAALLQILKYCDPHQIHIFDALYQSPDALVTWALRHIRQDRAALARLDAAASSQYMAARGGALRVFYQVKASTRTWSGQVRDAIAAELDPTLARWYRVEASGYDHFQIPRRYGWRVLADAAADVPGAHTEPATHHQAEHVEAAFQLATAEGLEAPWAATGQEVSEGEAFEAEGFEGEFPEETQSECQRDEERHSARREGLLTHASEEALGRLEPLAAQAEALGPDEEDPAGRSLTARLLEQSVLVAAIAAGQRSESVLTDRLFRLRHPEYRDKPIGKGDEAAHAEWSQIRDRQVVPLLLTGPFLGPMHDWLATSPVGTDLRKGVAAGAVLSPLSITRRGLRKAPTRQPGSVAAIVVHNTSRGPASRSRKGGYRRPAIEYALDHYLNGKEGFPHYVIDFNGTIYATCDERFVAWHAGWVHAGGAKLFRSGWTAPGWWSRVWSRQGAATPIDLLPKGARSPNYRTIGIELLLLPAMAYTPQQYKALARLIADIQQRNPDLQITQAPSRALLGHEDFAPVTADGGRADAHGGWDPGAHRDRPFFDWQRLWSEIQALGGKGAEAPGNLEAEAEAVGREEAGEEAGRELGDQLEAIAAGELAEPEFGEMEAFPFAPGMDMVPLTESPFGAELAIASETTGVTGEDEQLSGTQDPAESEELFEAEEFARHAIYQSSTDGALETEAFAATELPARPAADHPRILSTSQLRNAWRAYECAEHRMVRLRMFGRWNTPVNPVTVAAWRALERALAATGYEAHRAWVYNCRDISGQHTRSLHAYGLAIDIDDSRPTCNVNRATPDRREVRFSAAPTKEERCAEVRAGIADTSFTPAQIAAVEAIRTVDGHQVFAWGGRWRTTKDTMHFQINVTPGELACGIQEGTVEERLTELPGGLGAVSREAPGRFEAEFDAPGWGEPAGENQAADLSTQYGNITVSAGGFGTALRRFAKDWAVHDDVVSLLKQSPTYMSIVATLDAKYADGVEAISTVPIRGGMTAMTDDGVVTKGPYTGRRLIYFHLSFNGSQFTPIGDPDNPLSGDIIRLEAPPGTADPTSPENAALATIGRWIERIAHESVHAARRALGKRRPGKTAAERIRAAIDDEIETRKTERKIVDEIRKKSPKFAKYQPATGSFDRSAVERDFFPGEQKRTYLEQFVLSELLESSARTELAASHEERLPKAKEYEKIVSKITLGSPPFSKFLTLAPEFVHPRKGRMPIFRLRYPNILLALRVIDARWRSVKDIEQRDVLQDTTLENMRQEHAKAFFANLASYAKRP